MKKTMIIFAVMLLFTYCKKKEAFVQPNKNFSLEQTKKNDYEHFDYSSRQQTNLELFTLAVNEALKQKDFRTTLKQEAEKKFDGDFDVLLDFGKNTAYNRLEQMIVMAFSEINQQNLEESSLFFFNLSEEFPLLQLSVPIHCEEWDANSYIPNITYIPIGYDDTQDYAIKGFDTNGTNVWFNKFEKPNNAVVVICENERVSSEERNVPPGGGGGGGGGGSNYRSDGDREYVKDIYFSDLNAVEPWIKGKPEIRLHTFAGTGGGQLYSGFFNPSRSSVNHAWKAYNRSMFYWTTSNYGNFIIMKWIEEDNGSTITLSESYTYDNTTTTVTWTQSDKDDEIGGVAIGHTDPLTAEYDTGIMKWHERN